MVINAILHYAKELAEPIRGFAQSLIEPSKYLDKLKAYGDISGKTGEYFCNPENLAVEKRMYSDEVIDFNTLVDDGLKYQGKTVEWLNGFVNQQNLEYADKAAKCLSETHGIDPDSVAQFSEPAKEVLSYNMEKLYMVAPDLASHADVPFTGDAIASLILSGSVLGAMYGIAKLRGKFGSLFHNH